jgi:hypothetical protein
MKQEADTIVRAAQRITTCMHKFYSHKKMLSGAGNAFLLARSLKNRMWDTSQMSIRQVPNVGKAAAMQLAKVGLGTVQEVLKVDPHNCNLLQTAVGK